MITPLPQRVPENVQGDFYVEAGKCLRCCMPHGEAPGLMNDASVAFRECYFRRQPETVEEVEQAIRAVWVSEVGCLRYGGRDAGIIRRLGELGVGHTCDHAAVAPPKRRWWVLW